MSRVRVAASILVFAFAWQPSAHAQWTNRYPKVNGFSHHVYLEGYEMPTMAVGPTDPAPSPDGKAVAFSARGWLWLHDLPTGEARRLTKGAAMDSRPAWSPDGRRLAFVRDDTRDSSLMELDVATGTETVLVNTPAIDLDPFYSRDGKALYFSSAEAGDLDLYRLDLATKAKTRLTDDKGLELRPQPMADDGILFLAKGQGTDTVTVVNGKDKARRVLVDAPIASQMRPALHPDGRSLVVGVPGEDGYALWLYDVKGGPAIHLTSGRRGLPVMPAWSADGAWVYFAEADAAQQFRLYRIARGGGDVSEVKTLAWSWGEPTSYVQIRTRLLGGTATLPARLNVTDRSGHPATPDSGQVWFDGQNGLPFFYSPGAITVEVPAGEVKVQAAAGFGAAAVSASGTASAGQTATLTLDFTPIWNAADAGWFSGDHHFHLNYGGPYALLPEHLLPMMRGEGLDVATPLMANLHTRHNDVPFFGYTRGTPELPFIQFGQEIRPHFLGHTALVGVAAPYWPWYWGPSYPVFTHDDRPGGVALAWGRKQGGVASYVHPVMRPGPFPTNGPPNGLPLGLVPDALAGDVDTIEVACLWSDELGTADAWYRLLNVGVPLGPSAGTDTMSNMYRTMAVGTTRVYVKPDGPLTMATYLAALRAGHSFVTTGPLLTFSVQGVEPGGVVQARAASEVPFEATVASPIAFETIEVLINGAVVWSDKGSDEPGKKTYSARVKVPAGGWIAARVRGGTVRWPVMDSYPFAHTGAIWFGKVGSTEPAAARAAARELLQWMDIADKRLADGYAGADIPVLKGRFADARRRLAALATASGGTGSQ